MEPRIENYTTLKVYRFERDDVVVIYNLSPDATSDIELGFFTNKSKIKGAGKQLFCESLRWIKKNLSIQTVSLAAVPYANVYGKQLSKDNAQTKLNTYYKSLGFRPVGDENDHEFSATVDDLLAKCGGSGGRRKTRKQKRKIRKTLKK
jgi:predicted GNAT family N-acyltransferase